MKKKIGKKFVKSTMYYNLFHNFIFCLYKNEFRQISTRYTSIF